MAGSGSHRKSEGQSSLFPLSFLFISFHFIFFFLAHLREKKVKSYNCYILHSYTVINL